MGRIPGASEATPEARRFTTRRSHTTSWCRLLTTGSKVSRRPRAQPCSLLTRGWAVHLNSLARWAAHLVPSRTRLPKSALQSVLHSAGAFFRRTVRRSLLHLPTVVGRQAQAWMRVRLPPGGLGDTEILCVSAGACLERQRIPMVRQQERQGLCGHRLASAIRRLQLGFALMELPRSDTPGRDWCVVRA